jgi:hypothetical protein
MIHSGNAAGKKFDEARDPGGIFGDTGRFRATETALSRVLGGKATERRLQIPFQNLMLRPRMRLKRPYGLPWRCLPEG